MLHVYVSMIPLNLLLYDGRLLCCPYGSKHAKLNLKLKCAGSS
ncbi:F-box protein SKIP1-like [Iris pallida]|uniref:F-box protein SKIP1-like n=1 Tax=Iris pallida TaxID=29817 RepID=A0AAX6I7C3_IRIPA|nr:F-box protein SKIP1-like [Iris pallida]